jgi:SAM-dependent methyltransferase
MAQDPNISKALQHVACPLCNVMNSRFARELAGYNLERCLSCSFTFMNPQFTETAISQLYTRENYEELIALYARINNTQRLAQYNEKISRIEAFRPTKGRMLDFACGAGYFYEQAIARGWDAYGVELGDWCSEAARRRGLPNMHIGLLRDLDFPDDYFDVVNASQVFEHLPNPKADLKEIKRILRPGGLLVIDVPNYKTIPIWLNRDDFLLNTPPQHLNYFTPKDLRTLVVGAGLNVERVYTLAGLKLENLIGIPTISETADAYFKPVQHTPSADRAIQDSRRPSLLGRLKAIIRSALIKPILYDRLKVGMLLEAIARKPS